MELTCGIFIMRLTKLNTNTNEMITNLDTFGTVCSHVGMNVSMSGVSQILKDLHS